MEKIIEKYVGFVQNKISSAVNEGNYLFIYFLFFSDAVSSSGCVVLNGRNKGF
jgi:hypothetical protein